MSEHIRYNRTRREFLSNCFCGLGSLAFASMMAQEQASAAANSSLNPLAPKPPQIPGHAPAKSMIFLFMAGGPSHLETFDPKPLLNKLDGQKRPAEFGDVQYQNVNRVHTRRMRFIWIACSFSLVLTAIKAVRYSYGHFHSSRGPTQGTPTRYRVGQCQAYAPWLVI